MQDFKSVHISNLPVQDRMKAILKGHAMLPLTLQAARDHDENPLHRWVPAFPQGNILDPKLGYLKVFSDCLLVAEKGLVDNGAAPSMQKPNLHLPQSNKLFRTLRNSLDYLNGVTSTSLSILLYYPFAY